MSITLSSMRTAVRTVFRSFSQVQAVFVDVLGQVDRAQVAHRDLVLVGVQGDLGTQVGRVHDTHVLLRGAQVAGILEGHPGVTGFKQHAQHFAPQVLRLQCFDTV